MPSVMLLLPMKFKYFGDSYDIVKKSLISWLSEFGGWRAHPMFTESVTFDQSALFARFLGAELVSVEELTPKQTAWRTFRLAGVRGICFSTLILVSVSNPGAIQSPLIMFSA